MEKRRRNKLEKLRVEWASLVDAGANQHAEILLFKRDSSVQKYIKKVGDKFKVFSESGAVLGTHSTMADAQAQLAAIESNKKRRKKMSDTEKGFSDDIREALPEEAQDYIKSLETRLEERAEEEPDLKKSLPDEVRKFVDDLEKRAREAEDVAKAEREIRILKEWTEKARSYTHLSVDAAKLGAILKRLDEQSAEDREALEGLFAAADEQLGKSASLFAEIGAEGAVADEDSPSSRIDKMANTMVQKGEASDYIDALNRLQGNPEHRRLFEQYTTQKN